MAVVAVLDIIIEKTAVTNIIPSNIYLGLVQNIEIAILNREMSKPTFRMAYAMKKPPNISHITLFAHV